MDADRCAQKSHAAPLQKRPRVTTVGTEDSTIQPLCESIYRWWKSTVKERFFEAF